MTTATAPLILIVDDDWMNREMLQAHFEQASYQVITAHSGEKALELASAHTPDLIVLDARLQGIDGYQVCADLKARPATRHTPVVIFTAMEGDEEILKAVEAGADDFLSKPFHSLLMLTRVKSLLRLKSLHDELASRDLLLREVLQRHVPSSIAQAVLNELQRGT